MDDDEAVRRARSGDLDAYEALVTRYSAVAHRTAVLLGAGADAEDVVQDSFVKAFGTLHRFRAGAPFRPWLLRIVVNQTKNLTRGRRRRLALEVRAGAEPDRLVDPEQLVLDDLRRDALLAAVRALPLKDQLVLTCRFFLDLGEEETARVLDWPRGSVKSRTSRALGRLREQVGDRGREVTGG
ncbi:MAG: RNA polymerase sigma factor [Mycobacteriales bacterium]